MRPVEHSHTVPEVPPQSNSRAAGSPEGNREPKPTPERLRVDPNRWQYDFFFMDDFKVNSRLTLNLGVRYEMHLPWRENNDLISMFDIGSGKIVVPPETA